MATQALPPALHPAQDKMLRKLHLFNNFTHNLGLTSWQDKSFITKEQLDAAITDLKQGESSCLPLPLQRVLQRDELTARQAASVLRRLCASMGVAVLTKKVRHVNAEGNPSTKSIYRLAQ